MDPMPEIVPEASPEQEVGFLFSKLFKGVDLDREKTEAAKQAIRHDVDARRVRYSGPESAWTRDLALMAERDAAIQALLQNAEQQAAFRRNTAELQQMYEELRR